MARGDDGGKHRLAGALKMVVAHTNDVETAWDELRQAAGMAGLPAWRTLAGGAMPSRRTPISPEIEEQVLDLYAAKARLVDIEAATGLSRSSVYWVLRKNDVTPNRGAVRGDSESFADDVRAELAALSDRIDEGLTALTDMVDENRRSIDRNTTALMEALTELFRRLPPTSN